MKEWRQLKNYKDSVSANSVLIRAENFCSGAVVFYRDTYSFFEYNEAKLPIATQVLASSSSKLQ